MHNRSIPAVLVFLLTAGFFIYTLSPSLAWGDGVKLQSDAILGESFILTEMTQAEFTPDPFPFARVGIAAWDHPLHVMLGHLLVRALPAVDSLWLVNLISALFGASSVLLVFLLCHRHTGSLFASGYAALSLAVSHTFWWNSSTPEVYTLFIFLLLLGIYFFDQFEHSGRPSTLFISSFSLGLAASNHILAFLAFPSLILYFFLTKKSRRFQSGDRKSFLAAGMGFLAGFSIYIIQFMRVTRSIPFDQLMGPAVGSTFLGNLLNFSPLAWGESLLTHFVFLTFQFGPIGLMLGGLGIWKGISDLPARGVISYYVVYTLFGIFYRVTDQFAFFLTSYVFFAMLMAIGATHLLASLRDKPRLALRFVLILTIMLTPPFYHSVPALAARHGIGDSFLGIPQIGTGVRDGFAYYIDPYKRGDYGAYSFGHETISNLAPDAIVIAEWYTDTDEYFVLRYFHKIERLRPDVTILGWPTEDPFSFDPKLVLKAIEDSFPARPIYLASLSDRFYAASTLVGNFCILPENNLYRLYPKRADILCMELSSVTE